MGKIAQPRRDMSEGGNGIFWYSRWMMEDWCLGMRSVVQQWPQDQGPACIGSTCEPPAVWRPSRAATPVPKGAKIAVNRSGMFRCSWYKYRSRSMGVAGMGSMRVAALEGGGGGFQGQYEVGR